MLVADDALAQPPAEASGTIVTLGQVVTAQRLDTKAAHAEALNIFNTQVPTAAKPKHAMHFFVDRNGD